MGSCRLTENFPNWDIAMASSARIEKSPQSMTINGKDYTEPDAEWTL